MVVAQRRDVVPTAIEGEDRVEVAAQVHKRLERGPGWREGQGRAGLLWALAAGVIYFTVACAVYWPISPFDTRHLVRCDCADAVQQAWFLQWIAFALSHAQNPLFSTYINAPDGANLAVNTSMPLIGILGWPLTAISNSIAAYNFLLRLGLALSALSMYLVLRTYVRSRAAAFVGGLLFGFSPYMLAHGRLHIFLVFLPLLPPLILLIDRWLVRADRSPYRCGALVGLLLGLELLISAEMVVVSVIYAVIALIPLIIRHHDLVKPRLPLLLRGLGSAALVGLLIGGYSIWMFIAGPQRLVGPPHSVADLDSLNADLLSLILPSRPQLLRPPLLHAIAEQFVKGNDVENGFYLGIPLLVLVIVGSVRMRRQPLVMSFASLGVFSFVICLGVHLTVANHVTRIPLPLAAITGVPVLQEVGPSRFALAIPLAASVLLTLVLDRVLQRPGLKGIRGPAALAGLSLLVLLPLLPSSPNPSAPVRIPDYFSSSAVTEIPNGSTVLAYPYPCASRNRAMLWQTASHMRFRIIGAGVYVPAPSRHSTDCPHGDLSMNVLSVLIERRPWHVPSASQRSGLVRNLQGYVDSHSVDAIVVRTSGAQGQWISALMASAFGGPTSIHGDVSVWLKPVTI